MQFIRLPRVDWDLERLCFLEELCDDVIASRLHVSQVFIFIIVIIIAMYGLLIMRVGCACHPRYNEASFTL